LEVHSEAARARRHEKAKERASRRVERVDVHLPRRYGVERKSAAVREQRRVCVCGGDMG
jgi:hypothetical protein